jgi:outer membrane protein assembly factor BamA
VSISELELLAPAAGSQMANAAVGAIEFNQRWTDGGSAQHEVDAGFGVRAGSRELESDLAYRKYLGQGSYRYDFGRHHIQATGMAGRITGDAPMFERFALGDSTTLRGWDKYDIAPTGGDRVAYSSIEYRYSALALFLDVGSVWDADTERRVRVSSGFGLRAGPAFFLVGFPLNTDNVRAVFTMGLRFSGVGARW